MDVNVLALFIPIISILVTGAAVIYYLWAQNKERLAMIEKGVDPTKFQRRKINKDSAAKWGIVLIGGAFGIIMKEILFQYISLNEVSLFLISVLFLTGIALLIYYFTIGKKSEQKGE
jgi:uncharacterized membrane protein YbjE (DUF340 family)